MLENHAEWRFCSLSQIAWPYSGSRYPTVPRTMLDTWDPSTAGFDSPKSATFALMFLSRRMLLLLRSLWIIVGEHPVWRYSIPVFLSFHIQKTWWLIVHIQLTSRELQDIAEHRPFAASSAISRRFSQLVTFASAAPEEKPLKYYTHLYIFSLWVQPSNTPCCCRGCSE
jgi:hypothetical protein